MKKLFIGGLALLFFFSSSLTALAVSPASAKQVWLNAKKERVAAEVEHNQAKLDYQADQTTENDKAVIDTGKEVLNEVLDEAEAWLEWKKSEAENNPLITVEIQNNILSDVSKNLAKIKDLRADVDGIETRIELVTVFIKMAGSYLELLTDAARNSGALWVLVGNNLIEKSEQFESKLRTAAKKLDDNDEIMRTLDIAKTERLEALRKVKFAETSYKTVTIPGTPLIKFAEGNNHLRSARADLLSAQSELGKAFKLILAHKQ